jgi:hypothetical protein
MTYMDATEAAFAVKGRRVRVRPVQSPADVQALMAAAEADDHIVLWPTLMAEKDGQIAGYASVGQVALVNTKLITARDSYQLVGKLEEHVRQAGFPAMCFPCAHRSPFKPLMPRLGFTHVYDAGFWFKPLTKEQE